MVAGSHRKGKLDIGELLAAHGERLEGCGGRPLLARAGDVTLVNRNCIVSTAGRCSLAGRLENAFLLAVSDAFSNAFSGSFWPSRMPHVRCCGMWNSTAPSPTAVIRTVIFAQLGCILPRVPAMIVRTGTARRTTIIFGFHPKFAVDGVYTPEEIALRSRVIPLAIDAREPPRYRCHLGCILLKTAVISWRTGRQKWRREEPYAYKPLAEERWQGQTEAAHKIFTAKALGL